MLVDAFSVSSKQHVFHFEKNEDSFFIIVYLSGTDTFFWMQNDYAKPRSKYNSTFRNCIGKQVSQVVAFAHERSFAISFGSQHLLFALFGRHNSIMNMDEHFENEWHFSIKNVTFSFQVAHKLAAESEFVGKVLGKNIPLQVLENMQNAIVAGNFCLQYNSQSKIEFTYGHANCLYNSHNVLDCLREYARIWFRENHYNETYTRLEKQLLRDKSKYEKAIAAAEQQLQQIEVVLNYRLWADLIMANLHEITKGATLLKLPDFSDTETVEIPMRKNLNPQENAARYYRKSKNQEKEKELLQNRMDQLFEKLENVDEYLAQLRHCSDIKALQLLDKKVNPASETKKQLESKFIEFEVMGYKILVGRNAKNNDELTTGAAAKNDLWLHAKDLSGSHVVIRNKGSETNFPKNVIEVAASVAAYYSKGRQQEFCLVSYTLRKYVRKPKGAPAGAVLLDRETVLLARPELPN